MTTIGNCKKNCKTCSNRTSVIGLVGNIFLAAFKLIVGYLGQSRALVGSGMCTLSDVFSTILVYLGTKYSSKEPNSRYPFGYGKIESLAQIGVSLFMIIGNLVLLFGSFVIIAKRTIVVSDWIVFWTSIFCAVFNFLIYQFTSCGARELNSPALKSDAEHNKIDVASSLLVAVGVVATHIGIIWADPVIAIFEFAHVIHGSWFILLDGIKGAMDTSLPKNYLNEVRQTVLAVENIQDVKKVLARQCGEKTLLFISIILDPDLTVLESKHIVQMLRKKLRTKDRYLGHISVQVIPAE